MRFEACIFPVCFTDIFAGRRWMLRLRNLGSQSGLCRGMCPKQHRFLSIPSKPDSFSPVPYKLSPFNYFLILFQFHLVPVQYVFSYQSQIHCPANPSFTLKMLCSIVVHVYPQNYSSNLLIWSFCFLCKFLGSSPLSPCLDRFKCLVKIPGGCISQDQPTLQFL